MGLTTVQRYCAACDDFCPRYLACWLISTPSSPSLKVSVVGQSSHSQDEQCSFSSYREVNVAGSFISVAEHLNEVLVKVSPD